ncbi:MAG TPA: hypothetical protein VGM29_14495 [Polyangiaceae bacterium]
MPGRARRIFRGALRLVALSSLVLTLGSCAPGIGVGVAAGVLGIALLTHQCYDYLDVTVYDGAGRSTCAADVFAEKGSNSVRLTSCYYTPLSDGTWTLRAHYPGVPDATSTVIVEHPSGCTAHVQSAALTLGAGAVAPVAPPVAPAPYGLPPPPPPPPVVAPMPARTAPAPAPNGPTQPNLKPAKPPTAAPAAPAPTSSQAAPSAAPPSAAFPALPAGSAAPAGNQK